MLSVHLHNIILPGRHGLYEEEKLTGNRFELDLTVWYNEPKGAITSSNVIDYVLLYETVKERMLQATPLLEALAMDIADEVLRRFPPALEVNISIKKLHPPVLNFEGSAGIGLVKKRTPL